MITTSLVVMNDNVQQRRPSELSKSYVTQGEPGIPSQPTDLPFTTSTWYCLLHGRRQESQWYFLIIQQVLGTSQSKHKDCHQVIVAKISGCLKEEQEESNSALYLSPQTQQHQCSGS